MMSQGKNISFPPGALSLTACSMPPKVGYLVYLLQLYFNKINKAYNILRPWAAGYIARSD